MRRAFSLLELIIAIVVIALSIAALPFVVGGAMRGNSAAIVQEMITATKSVISDATTYPWNTATADDITHKEAESIWLTSKDNRYNNIIAAAKSDDSGWLPNARTYIIKKETADESGVTQKEYLSYDVSNLSDVNPSGKMEREGSASDDNVRRVLRLNYTNVVSSAKVREVKDGDSVSGYFSELESSKNADIIYIKTTVKLEAKEGESTELAGVSNKGVVLKAYSFNIGRAY